MAAAKADTMNTGCFMISLKGRPSLSAAFSDLAAGNSMKCMITNDNNATTPEATIAALNSFPERTIILIAGGSDKGLDLEDLHGWREERHRFGKAAVNVDWAVILQAVLLLLQQLLPKPTPAT